jgi:hypothetical protein
LIEWFSVDVHAAIRIAGTFDVTLAVTGRSEKPWLATMETDIEAAILAMLINQETRPAVN